MLREADLADARALVPASIDWPAAQGAAPDTPACMPANIVIASMTYFKIHIHSGPCGISCAWVC